MSKNFREKAIAPHLALLAVQMMFGSATVIGKIALNEFPPNAIVGFRVVGAALAFILLQTLTGGMRLARRGDYLRFAGLSLLGVVFNQLFFIKGLSLTTATNTSLLAVLIPVFATVAAAAFGIDRLSWRKVFGISLAACGVIYLVNPARASFSAETTRGDLLIIVNCAFYAAYIALSKDVLARNGALKSIAWLFLFGSVICLPVGAVALFAVDLTIVSARAWAAVGAMILIPTISAYYFNAWAMARVAPSTVAVYIFLQPLIGFLLAVLFLGEVLSTRALFAGLLIFAGVFLVTRKSARDKSSAETHETLH